MGEENLEERGGIIDRDGKEGAAREKLSKGELGLHKISSRRILLRLRFWSKLININKD